MFIYFKLDSVLLVYEIASTKTSILQGSDHLTVTWKVADGICQHIDVREEGKENAFSLGLYSFLVFFF